MEEQGGQETRSVILKTRVKPSAAVEFRKLATDLGFTESSAIRDALVEWSKMKKAANA